MIAIPTNNPTTATTTPLTRVTAYVASLGSLTSGLRNFHDSKIHHSVRGQSTVTAPTTTLMKMRTTPPNRKLKPPSNTASDNNFDHRPGLQ